MGARAGRRRVAQERSKQRGGACARACRLAGRSRFLIHLLACPWGSIISGQRRALATTMPFSMEKESLGRPAISQSRTLTGSPRMAESEKRGVCATSAAPVSATKSSMMEERQEAVKAPR